MPIPLTALPPLTPLTVQDCFGLIWPHWFTHTQTHTYTHKLGARSHLMSTQKHEQCIWFHLCVYEMHIMFMKHQPRCRPWSFESAFNVEEAVLSSFHDCLHTHSLDVCGHVATVLLRATLRSFWRWHETDKGGQMSSGESSDSVHLAEMFLPTTQFALPLLRYLHHLSLCLSDFEQTPPRNGWIQWQQGLCGEMFT